MTGSGQDDHHWQVGGHPPEAALGAVAIAENMQYFATIPFVSENRDDFVCSVFLTPFDELIESSGAWNELGQVSVVVHEPGPRAEHWNGPVALTGEHGIRILDRQDDVEVGIDNWVMGKGGQKFGGRPTFLQRERLEDDWAALEQDGFRQLVQFDVPTFESGVKRQGRWPFGDGVFNLAFREKDNTLEWRWCWQL